MKRLILALLLLSLPLAPIGWTGMTCANSNTAYKTIGAVEQSVLSANAAFLDAVVSGQAPTNNVPAIEAAFNDTQMSLHAAASIASGGANAPIPAAVNTKAMNFTNSVALILKK